MRLLRLILCFFIAFFDELIICNGQAALKPSDIIIKEKKIYLGARDLKVLPTWLPHYQKIKEANLSGNPNLNLHEAFEVLSKLDNLEELVLNGTKIDSIPSNICKLKKLRVLDIRSDGLISIPQTIRQLNKLDDIMFAGNILDSIQLNNIIKLLSVTNIKTLSISINNRRSIPLCICSLNKLEFLYFVDADKLEIIPECIYSLPNLKYLNFTGRSFTEEELHTMKSKFARKVAIEFAEELNN